MRDRSLVIAPGEGAPDPGSGTARSASAPTVTTTPPGSAWAPLSVPVFRALWLGPLTFDIRARAHGVRSPGPIASVTTGPPPGGLLHTAGGAPTLHARAARTPSRPAT